MSTTFATHEQRASSVGFSRNDVIALAIAVISAFLCHALFMHLYYWRWFHSDSAAAYIVAQQILTEGRMFPAHFIFGNDLFLLRPQFAIALFMKAGLNGYTAYTLATSLMFSIAFGIVAFCLMLLRPRSVVPLIAAGLLFIPINMNEVDFILGQQSHLMQSSLALTAAILFYRCSLGLAGRITALMLFVIVSLLTVDSVMRALLAVSAIVAVSFILLPWSKRLYMTIGACILAIAVGLVIRNLIILQVQFIGVGSMVIDLNAGAIIRKWAALWTDIKPFVVSAQFLTFQDFGSALFTIADVTIIAACVVSAIWLAWKLLTSILKYLTTFERQQGDALLPVVLIGSAGLLITLAALGAATLTSLGPVIRHAVPGLFLIKFVVAWMIADACVNKQTKIKAFGYVMAAVFVLASPVTLALVSKAHRMSQHTNQRAHLHNTLTKLREQEIIRNGQGRIYGDFWDVYRYAALSGTALTPAPVQVVNGQVVSFDFLSIPERYCAVDNQPSVFIVRKTDSKMLAAMSPSASKVDLTQDLVLFQEMGRDLKGCVRR
ncbi:hypothetical protein MHY87_07155 [Microvirga sp. ACRRW]|uniref:hypothetical protein n=1 Tax=Microvirga sp. ACRRW TaxID=2918205 RepID=UPI001EF6DA95|nr:hypothetical protein [Microvirga sp. ACRRW]MCG7392679.1 hypothetical protein [Microvirga sp. ACRRW]